MRSWISAKVRRWAYMAVPETPDWMARIQSESRRAFIAS